MKRTKEQIFTVSKDLTTIKEYGRCAELQAEIVIASGNLEGMSQRFFHRAKWYYPLNSVQDCMLPCTVKIKVKIDTSSIVPVQPTDFVIKRVGNDIVILHS